MITDIHCHFIPDRLFKFVQARARPDARVTAADGERIDLTVRGMHYGLNATFFEPERQVARMEKLGIDRTVISSPPRWSTTISIPSSRARRHGFATTVC